MIGIVLEDVPSAEEEVFQVGQRNEFLDQWRATLGAYVNRELVEEAEKANGNFMNSVALQMLRRSLGYADE